MYCAKMSTFTVYHHKFWTLQGNSRVYNPSHFPLYHAKLRTDNLRRSLQILRNAVINLGFVGDSRADQSRPTASLVLLVLLVVFM